MFKKEKKLTARAKAEESLESERSRDSEELQEHFAKAKADALKEAARQEGARAAVLERLERELEDAWEEGVDLMKSEQQAALQKQTAITTTTYNRKFDEFKANLDAEYADALKKHEEAKAASKKRSSGIFSWLSPSNKRRRGGDEEDEEED